MSCTIYSLYIRCTRETTHLGCHIRSVQTIAKPIWVGPKLSRYISSEQLFHARKYKCRVRASSPSAPLFGLISAAGYPDWSFSLFYLVPPRRARYSNGTHYFQFLPNCLLTNSPTFRQIKSELLAASLNKPKFNKRIGRWSIADLSHVSATVRYWEHGERRLVSTVVTPIY
jgi:hypothetical protein